MALLATQRPTLAGLAFAGVVADVHEFIPTNHSAVYVSNGSAAAITATIPTPAKVDGAEVADIIVSVPAGATRYIAAPPRICMKSNGRADLTFSATASVTCAVLEIVNS